MPVAEANEEEFDYPDYIKRSPLLYKYVGMVHQLLDLMHEETKDLPIDEDFETFHRCLLTMHLRILFDGEMEELDQILRIHFPDTLTHEDNDMKGALTAICLSTSN